VIRVIVATLDIISSVLSLACIALIIVPAVRKALGRELLAIAVTYLSVGLLYQISLVLEWTLMTAALDPYEDYLQFFQPFLLIFFLYSYVRGRAAQDVNEEERRHQILFNTSADAIFFLRKDPVDGNYKCIDVNERAVVIFGYSRDEFLNKQLCELCVSDQKRQIGEGLNGLQPGERAVNETQFTAKNGVGVPVEVTSQRYRQAGRDLVISSVKDLTSQKRMENEIRHSQRMESVGRLAGGVAHDFNNILTVITGYSDLVLSSMTEENDLRADVAEIRRAADRAVALTRQLLAFSRKQVMQPKSIAAREVLDQARMLLTRLIGENVELAVRTSDDSERFLADPAQIEQVVMNLAVNARDAMPGGGKLELESSVVDVMGTDQNHRPGMDAGRYVLIVCTDSGSGIDEETLNHIFEPFYTTKKRGKGTGLGLSTAYGIVKQSGGFIYVDSELGEGTTVEIFLPVVDESGEIEEEREEFIAPAVGVGTILLVEDETAVRNYTASILKRIGYIIIEARDGEEALKIVGERGGELDLVISDIVMPKMGGPELLDSIAESYPDVKVIFMTGYAGDYVVRSELPADYELILSKPFSSQELLALISKTLAVSGPHH
jgi:two-component system, cell cycle sensor histidine kinase and response regulator CckA